MLRPIKQKARVPMSETGTISSKMPQTPLSGKGLKVMTPAQMLQRLPIAMAQIKAGNNSQTLKNEIRQMLYSLYQAKQLTKKIYQDLMSKI